MELITEADFLTVVEAFAERTVWYGEPVGPDRHWVTWCKLSCLHHVTQRWWRS